jgi:hypothetical protein
LTEVYCNVSGVGVGVGVGVGAIRMRNGGTGRSC